MIRASKFLLSMIEIYMVTRNTWIASTAPRTTTTNFRIWCIVYHDDIFRDSVSTQYDNQQAFLIAQKLVNPKFYARNERKD